MKIPNLHVPSTDGTTTQHIATGTRFHHWKRRRHSFRKKHHVKTALDNYKWKISHQSTHAANAINIVIQLYKTNNDSKDYQSLIQISDQFNSSLSFFANQKKDMKDQKLTTAFLPVTLRHRNKNSFTNMLFLTPEVQTNTYRKSQYHTFNSRRPAIESSFSWDFFNSQTIDAKSVDFTFHWFGNMASAFEFQMFQLKRSSTSMQRSLKDWTLSAKNTTIFRIYVF